MFDSYDPVGRYNRFPRKKSESRLVILLKNYRETMAEKEELIRALRELIQKLEEKIFELDPH